MVLFFLAWAVLGIPVVALWRWVEQSADPVARIEAAVARDERRIRRLLAANWRDVEIVARYPNLQAHHVAAVRGRVGQRQPGAPGVERRLRRRFRPLGHTRP